MVTIGPRLRESFRIPTEQDPEPRPARLIGLCSWAAALGLIGLPVAGRASVVILTNSAPPWFEPVVVSLGAIGMFLTAAAFTAVHRRRLPWMLLGSATVALAVNLAVTVLS